MPTNPTTQASSPAFFRIGSNASPDQRKLFSTLTPCRQRRYDIPKRISLQLGHPFCYKQIKRILYIDIDIRDQLSDISQSKKANLDARSKSDISPQRPKT
jgi:hypothetical protein